MYKEQDNQHLLDAYEIRLREAAEGIKDDMYRNIACNALQRLDYLTLLRMSPYQLEGTLAHQGGLLVYTVHLVEATAALAKACHEVDGSIDRSFLTLASMFYMVGWNTTTTIINDNIKRRDAFITTGIERSGFRFMHDLLQHVESDLGLGIPEERKQALGDIYGDPHTLEGNIIKQAGRTIDIILFAEENAATRKGNWSPDHHGFFVGHHS